MRLYDWKTFLASMLCGAATVWMVVRLINEGNMFRFFQALLFGYWTIKGILSSVTKDGYEEQQCKRQEEKVMRKKLFGTVGEIMVWVYFGIFFLSALVILLLPEQNAVSLTLFCVGVGLIFLSQILYLYYAEKEKAAS